MTLTAKLYAVRMLAEGFAHADIQQRINSRFGLSVSREQIKRLHPQFNRVSPKIEKKFYDYEKEFLDKTAENFPISRISYRLNRLQQMERMSIAAGDVDQHLRILKQAAQEVGNAFQNRIELSGIDGSPIKIQQEIQQMSDQELIEEIKRLTLVATDTINNASSNNTASTD